MRAEQGKGDHRSSPYPSEYDGVRAVREKQTAPISSEPIEALLLRVPFFQTLDRVDLARLAGALEEVRLPAGTQIFSEGAEADALYLLASGRVEIMLGAGESEKQVAVLEAPSYFGELGLLLARRTGSVRTSTEILAWKLPRERFDQLARERTAIALAVATPLRCCLISDHASASGRLSQNRRWCRSMPQRLGPDHGGGLPESSSRSGSRSCCGGPRHPLE